MNTSLVIPIKQLNDAKQRLASILEPIQRRMLFQAMVEDVLEVAASCENIDDVIVITSDETVSALAYKYGAQVLPEPATAGLIEAVTFAAETLANRGCESMLFLPGDIPLVTAEELKIVTEGFGRSNDAEFLIVPSRDLGGSNCILCSPPNCITFGFGEDSFRRHLSLAKDKGISPVVIKLPGIGLDVDTPEDLRDLIDHMRKENLTTTNTAKYLMSLSIDEDGFEDKYDKIQSEVRVSL